MWRSEFQLLDSFNNFYSIIIVLRKTQFTFMYMGVYGPQEDRDKIIFLQELTNICQMNDFHWILAGNFNIIRELTDTIGHSMNLDIMQSFNNLIDNLGLIDVPLHERTFTWLSKRPISTFSRLDRTLISYYWENSGNSYSLRDLPAMASDHAPLLLYIKPHTQPRKRTFRFKLFWLKYPKVHQVVSRAWTTANPTSGSLSIKLRRKITATQRELTSWA